MNYSSIVKKTGFFDMNFLFLCKNILIKPYVALQYISRFSTWINFKIVPSYVLRLKNTNFMSYNFNL